MPSLKALDPYWMWRPIAWRTIPLFTRAGPQCGVCSAWRSPCRGCMADHVGPAEGDVRRANNRVVWASIGKQLSVDHRGPNLRLVV